MKDKNLDGVLKETQYGLTIASVYFQTTKGIPKEIFQEMLNKMNTAHQVLWYMQFRSKNPQLYENI